MNAKEHQELLEKYISYGGNQRITEACRRFSLQNFAKLKYEFSRLNKPAEAKVSAEIPTDKPTDQESGIPKMRGVEFRNPLVFKGSGIPNKVFLEFFGEWNSELFIICISFLFFRVFWGILLEVFSLYEFVYTK